MPAGQSSSAEPGEMVLVEITRWPTAQRGPVGRVAEVFGHDQKAQARHLIEHAAHPDVREELWEEAHALSLA